MTTLHNLHIINKGILDISIEHEKITAIESNSLPNKNGIDLYFDNAIAFPGIINNHDHLHFNLFPQLGNKIYTDYIEWEQDVQQNNKKEIDEVVKIPEQLRVQWSLYKNLLNGVTTVVHHDKLVDASNAFINVFQNCHPLHSLEYEKYWKLKLNNPFKNKWPFVVHIGEGTSAASHKEIDTLVKWNMLQKELIAVHGVSMNSLQAKHFKALIWCPDSNYFLLDATAQIDELKHQTKILFGTDSTLSANWNLWKQLNNANKLSLLTPDELYASLTTTAAEVWGLNNTAKIEKGYIADIVIAKKKSNDDYDALFSLTPEDILLVMHKGNIRLFDESIQQQIDDSIKNNFSRVHLNGSTKYVYGNLPALIREIKQYQPNASFPVTI